MTSCAECAWKWSACCSFQVPWQDEQVDCSLVLFSHLLGHLVFNNREVEELSSSATASWRCATVQHTDCQKCSWESLILMMEVFVSYSTIFAEGAIIGKIWFLPCRDWTNRSSHFFVTRKVIVHFDEAYGWRESILRGLSSHIAQLFISLPGDIVSTERNWKWWFFTCARDLSSFWWLA